MGFPVFLTLVLKKLCNINIMKIFTIEIIMNDLQYEFFKICYNFDTISFQTFKEAIGVRFDKHVLLKKVSKEKPNIEINFSRSNYFRDISSLI